MFRTRVSHSLPRLVLLALLFASLARGSMASSLRGTVLRESFRPSHVGETLSYEIYLPPAHRDGAGLPYVLFLPGYRDDQTYCRRKGFFATAETMMQSARMPPTGIVCVGRGRGIWIDAAPDDRKYETALVVDLLGRLEGVHRFPAGSGMRAILGISLGGFGALKTALRHPGLFRAVAALSPYLDETYEDKVSAGVFPWKQGTTEEQRQVFGHPVGTEARSTGSEVGFDVDRALREDPFWLVRHAERPIRTPFYLACGRQDKHGLVGPTERLRALLAASGAEVRGEIQDGGHNDRFWLKVLPGALGFLSGAGPGPGSATSSPAPNAP